jgi:hypothetical protein
MRASLGCEGAEAIKVIGVAAVMDEQRFAVDIFSTLFLGLYGCV